MKKIFKFITLCFIAFITISLTSCDFLSKEISREEVLEAFHEVQSEEISDKIATIKCEGIGTHYYTWWSTQKQKMVYFYNESDSNISIDVKKVDGKYTVVYTSPYEELPNSLLGRPCIEVPLDYMEFSEIAFAESSGYALYVYKKVGNNYEIYVQTMFEADVGSYTIYTYNKQFRLVNLKKYGKVNNEENQLKQNLVISWRNA